MVVILLFMLLLTGEKVNAQPTQTAGRGEQQQTASQSPSPTVNNPHPQIDNPANAASSGENKERDAKDNAFKAEQLRQSRVIVRATVWIAVFSGLSFGAVLVYAIVSLLQWREIKKQAGHAGEQVGAMQGQLDAIEKQAGIMDQSLVETRNIVSQNERAVEAAEKSVKAVQDSTLYAQRAYISVTPEPSDQYHFQLRIENSGNTPASDVEIFANSNVFSEEEAVAFDEQGDCTSLGVIGPRCFYTKVLGIGRTIYSGEVEVWRKERRNLYCWGRVKYRDTFGNADRNTWFCFYKVIGSEQTLPYSVGNNAT
jgi:hypothetical protein